MRRIHSLDYVKTFLAVIVVLAHTNWLQTHLSPPVFVLGNGLLRTVVPLFCIIAGYFLHTAVERGRTVRWLWRVMALYLFWMVAYLPIWKGQVHSLWSLTTTLLWGFFHLWFLIGMFIAGLVLTGLNWMGRKIAPRHALWFVAVPAALCAMAGLALEYADLFGVIQISEQRYRNGLFLCFPFLAIGYLIHSRIKAPGARPLPSARLLLPVTLAGLVLMGVEAWLVQSRLGLDVMIEIPFAGYVAVPALFLLCLQVEMPPQPVDLGLISATIYFLHVWAFRLADVLGIHSLPGLMLMGVGVPVLAALSYGAASGRLRGRAARRPHGG